MSQNKVSDSAIYSNKDYPSEYRNSNSDENRMFHKAHQMQNVKQGKLGEGPMTCIGYICFGIFKKLIYVFVFIIIFSFMAMLRMITKDSTDQMGVKTSLHGEAFSSLDLKTINDYIFHGEAFIKSNNMTKAQEDNIEYGVTVYVKDSLIKHGNWKVHPLFKDLQAKSPYTVSFKVPEYDNSP